MPVSLPVPAPIVSLPAVPTVEDVLLLLQAVVVYCHGSGVAKVEIKVKLANGRKVSWKDGPLPLLPVVPIPIPIPVPVPAAATVLIHTVGPALSETEQTVVGAIGPDHDVSGKEIARRCCYTNEGWFRDVLSKMRERGILTGPKGAPGYTVMPPYRRPDTCSDARSVPTERGPDTA